MRNPLNPLRGWHVLVMIIAFFSVTIGVNATFITLALRTHPGEAVPRSYVQGLSYNDTLDRRRAQEALGWTARVNLVDRNILVAIAAEDGAPISGLNLAGTLVHLPRLSAGIRGIPPRRVCCRLGVRGAR